MRPLSRFRPLLLSAFIAVPVLVHAQQARPLATIDGAPITEEEVKAALDDIGPSLQQMGEAEKRKYVLDYLIDLKLLARSAEKQKLGEGPAFASKLAYLKERALMEMLMAQIGAGAVTDEKLRTFYDEAVKGLAPDLEVRARHILVEKEEDAKKIHARVKAGEDFAKLAKELSKDPGSGKEGGDLGYFTKDRMVPEFSEVAYKLKVGEVSEPVKSQFGWHIIKVEDTRSKAPPPLDQVREELSRYMVQKAQQDVIMKLRTEAKIDRAEDKAPDAKPAETKPAEAPKQ